MCPRLDGNNLYTSPLFKNMVRVSKPTRTCKIFLAFVHNLTFLSCVQGLLEKACFLRHFGKNERRRRSLSEHVISSSPWQGLHFSIFSPKLGRELYSPPPFLKKRTPGPAKPGQARPGQARPGQARPGQARPGQARPTSQATSQATSRMPRMRGWLAAAGLACWLLDT